MQQEKTQTGAMTCRIADANADDLLDAFGVSEARIDFLMIIAKSYAIKNRNKDTAGLISHVSSYCQSPEELMILSWTLSAMTSFQL